MKVHWLTITTHNSNHKID